MVSFSAPITVVIKGVFQWCVSLWQFNLRFEHQGKKVSFGEVVYNVKKTLFHRSVLPSLDYAALMGQP